MKLPKYAGVRVYRLSPETGTIVALFDAEKAGLDTAGGRWATVCEDHGTICNHRTYKVALSHLDSCGWCAECMETFPRIDTRRIAVH